MNIYLDCLDEIQILLFLISALNQYAIITYILDYILKGEQNMTQSLKDVLFKTQHLSKIEQLNALKQAWLKCRQIGASEAVYRLISGLHLTASNISTIFVATGFPENRSVFFKKITDKSEQSEDLNKSFDEDDLEENEEDIIDNEQDDGSKAITIPGREGKFKPSISIHERYAQRPDYLEKMCLGQFASVYVFTTRMKKGTDWSKEDGEKRCSEAKSHLTLFDSEEKPLPEYIDLREFNLGIMRARSSPKVLRIHSSHRKEGDEQYYAELLLYLPWRDEKRDLRPDNSEDICMHLYHDEKNKEIIKTNKNKLYAGHVLGDILEEAEDFKIDKDKPSHVFDMIAAQNVQNQEDDEAEGVEDDPEFANRNPGKELSDKANQKSLKQEPSYFKAIVMPEDDDLLEMTRQMVPEQQFALKQVLKYSKATRRSLLNPSYRPKQLMMILIGGAGK